MKNKFSLAAEGAGPGIDSTETIIANAASLPLLDVKPDC